MIRRLARVYLERAPEKGEDRRLAFAEIRHLRVSLYWRGSEMRDQTCRSLARKTAVTKFRRESSSDMMASKNDRYDAIL